MKKVSFLAALSALILLGASCKKDNDVNRSPVADAGVSQTITLPVSSVTLTGTGKDPDGRIVTYLWEQVSGPAASVIVNPGSPSTLVQGLKQGTYVFQLSVFDSLGGVGTDTTSVIVKPAETKVLTLQPNNNSLEYTINEIGGTDKTNITVNALDIESWTLNGSSYTCRSIVKYDLSPIPSSSTIKSAHLFLYSVPVVESGNLHDANSGNNAFYVQQVATDWSTSTLSWSNQPSGLTSNQILVPSTTQAFLDMDIDVTSQVAAMVNGGVNYGFLMKLQTEAVYASRLFVSSHNQTYPDKHPKLVISYE
jgi:hypothetical protein